MKTHIQGRIRLLATLETNLQAFMLLSDLVSHYLGYMN